MGSEMCIRDRVMTMQGAVEGCGCKKWWRENVEDECEMEEWRVLRGKEENKQLSVCEDWPDNQGRKLVGRYCFISSTQSVSSVWACRHELRDHTASSTATSNQM